MVISIVVFLIVRLMSTDGTDIQGLNLEIYDFYYLTMLFD
jgi:hypothetical protein